MWNWPNESIEKQFTEIAKRVWEKKEISFPQTCANCEHTSVHIFYYKFREDRASLWVWCDNCFNFKHSTAIPPSWWQNLVGAEAVDIQKNQLSLDILNSYKNIIDSHVNSLLKDNQ
jgi:hypothetical protein